MISRGDKCYCGRIVAHEIDDIRLCGRCFVETAEPPPGDRNRIDLEVLDFYRRQKTVVNCEYYYRERHYDAITMPRRGWQVVGSGAWKAVNYSEFSS